MLRGFTFKTGVVYLDLTESSQLEVLERKSLNRVLTPRQAFTIRAISP